VFVHGTFSSPIYWAEMWNTLEADPELRARYQAWVYIYNSGNPLTFSAANMREALTEIVARLDPAKQDPALQQMVLVGHSQGGLLVKLAVTETEDKIWRLLSDKKLEELDISEELRAEIQRNVFIEPLPFVKRAIFMATPHRGSYLATHFARRFTARLMRMPSKVVKTASQLAHLKETVRLPRELRRGIPTSLDGMSPKNPLLLAIADMPPAPGVKCHSIIAVKGQGPQELGKDGVVAYKSAHLGYSESEFVVRCSHSCQANPAAIEEVRRILLEHLAQSLPGSTGAIPPK
jgi:pimeloyl-ACP methyl ester carboxylesterase